LLISIADLHLPEVDTFNLLLNRSRLENKKLFLVFSFQGCSICRIFDKYHIDSIVNGILSPHFIIRKIDYYKTPGGRELYAYNFRIRQRPFALFAINIIFDTSTDLIVNYILFIDESVFKLAG
jgi:hypothetical protein